MKINALTVCVNYADILSRVMMPWHGYLESLTIVTAPDDTATQQLASKYEGVRLHVTDAFYRDGAAFNKGRAMNEAIEKMPWQDWILFFDSDILPPLDWYERLVNEDCQPGKLYGSNRYQAFESTDTNAQDVQRWQMCLSSDYTAPLMHDQELPGYFQLFHSTDPAVQQRPLLDGHWLHAGNYDSTFQDRWGRGSSLSRKVRLPLRLLHLGLPGQNWWGRGPDAKSKTSAMWDERRRRGGWQHERIQTPG